MAVVIPETITVHLGTPQSSAENYTVNFPDYIKNVASGEIYPTWPQNAIRANIYAQITFALNRVTTEYYRSRGYNFDITNSTAYDQYFKPNREIYDIISEIVDEIFNSYVQRQGTVGPYFTQYCDGRQTTCEGLSQWGTVPLANQGYSPYSILQYYYGDDIDIVTNVAIQPNVQSYRGTPIQQGESGNEVKQIQLRLNRISDNYPSIPKLYPVDGVFGQQTYSAVLEFQRIFNLTQDGIVGKSTWYKLIFVYNAVKKLSELDSEGISVEEYSQQYPDALTLGDRGDGVIIMQYYLSTVSEFYPTIPDVDLTAVYDEKTLESVKAFQRQFLLDDDGVVGEKTWDTLYNAYLGIVGTNQYITGGIKLYPGTPLRVGTVGEDVRTLQEYLDYISKTYSEITAPQATGIYSQQTANSVMQFQELFGLKPTGMTGPITWAQISETYSDLIVGNRRRTGQFSGYVLQKGE